MNLSMATGSSQRTAIPGEPSLKPVIILSFVFHVVIFGGIPLLTKVLYHSEKFERPKTFQLVRFTPPSTLTMPQMVRQKAEAKPKTATTPVPRKQSSRQAAKKQVEEQKENTEELSELLGAIPTKVSDLSISQNFKFNWYVQNMQSRIEENFKPPMGLTERKDAATVLTFTVFENGTISDVTVVRPSGIATLDNCAVRAVKESAPFGKLPLSFPDKRLDPTVTLFYVKK
jgi:TonB family protein